jgi:hypothetical protein
MSNTNQPQKRVTKKQIIDAYHALVNDLITTHFQESPSHIIHERKGLDTTKINNQNFLFINDNTCYLYRTFFEPARAIYYKSIKKIGQAVEALLDIELAKGECLIEIQEDSNNFFCKYDLFSLKLKDDKDTKENKDIKDSITLFHNDLDMIVGFLQYALLDLNLNRNITLTHKSKFPSLNELLNNLSNLWDSIFKQADIISNFKNKILRDIGFYDQITPIDSKQIGHINRIIQSLSLTITNDLKPISKHEDKKTGKIYTKKYLAQKLVLNH